MRTFISRVGFCSLAFANLVLLAGCGGGDSKPEAATMTGTITYNGKPVTAGWIITTSPSSTSGGGRAVIYGDGTYEVTATSGTVQVAIQTQKLKNPQSPEFSEAQYACETMGKPAPKYVAIPAKYETPEKSDLSYELKPGENKIDITLTD